MLQEFKDTLIAKGGPKGLGLDEGKVTRVLHLLLSRAEQAGVAGHRLLEQYDVPWNAKKPAESLQAVLTKMNGLTPEDRHNLAKHVFGNHRDTNDALWVLFDNHREKAPVDVVLEGKVEESKPLVSLKAKKDK